MLFPISQSQALFLVTCVLQLVTSHALLLPSGAHSIEEPSSLVRTTQPTANTLAISRSHDPSSLPWQPAIRTRHHIRWWGHPGNRLSSVYPPTRIISINRNWRRNKQQQQEKLEQEQRKEHTEQMRKELQNEQLEQLRMEKLEQLRTEHLEQLLKQQLAHLQRDQLEDGQSEVEQHDERIQQQGIDLQAEMRPVSPDVFKNHYVDESFRYLPNSIKYPNYIYGNVFHKTEFKDNLNLFLSNRYLSMKDNIFSLAKDNHGNSGVNNILDNSLYGRIFHQKMEKLLSDELDPIVNEVYAVDDIDQNIKGFPKSFNLSQENVPNTIESLLPITTEENVEDTMLQKEQTGNTDIEGVYKPSSKENLYDGTYINSEKVEISVINSNEHGYPFEEYEFQKNTESPSVSVQSFPRLHVEYVKDLDQYNKVLKDSKDLSTDQTADGNLASKSSGSSAAIRDLGRGRRAVADPTVHAEKCHANNLWRCGQPVLNKLDTKDADMKTLCKIREDFLSCMIERRYVPCPSTNGSANAVSDPKLKELRTRLKKKLATNCFIGYSIPQAEKNMRE